MEPLPSPAPDEHLEREFEDRIAEVADDPDEELDQLEGDDEAYEREIEAWINAQVAELEEQALALADQFDEAWRR